MKESDQTEQGLTRRVNTPANVAKRAAVTLPIYCAPFLAVSVVETAIWGPLQTHDPGRMVEYVAGVGLAYVIGSTTAGMANRAMKRRQARPHTLTE